MLRASAPSKLNLSLEVLGKRKDGFHEVRTVLLAIDLCDSLCFQLADEVSLLCRNASLLTGDNTIIQSARLLQKGPRSGQGAIIQLEKHIPVAAGLGGGSSDGTAALRSLNALWGMGLGGRELLSLAARIGADAPFFLLGGTALGEGKGDRLTPLPPAVIGPVVLLVPPLTGRPDKTSQMYALLDSQLYGDGKRTRRLVASLEQGQEVDPSELCNVFEEVAARFFPDLQAYRQVFREAGAPQVHLAGSGPALFAMVDGEERALHIRDNLRLRKLAACVVHPWRGTVASTPEGEDQVANIQRTP